MCTAAFEKNTSENDMSKNLQELNNAYKKEKLLTNRIDELEKKIDRKEKLAEESAAEIIYRKSWAEFLEEKIIKDKEEQNAIKIRMKNMYPGGRGRVVIAQLSPILQQRRRGPNKYRAPFHEKRPVRPARGG